jgi:ribonuclease HI
MLWKKHRLRDTDVWAKVDATGTLVSDADGRVDIVYKPAAGAKVYRAGARNLVAAAGEPVELEPGERAPDRRDQKAPPPDAIHVWTDGGASPNPGPAGVGIVIVDGEKRTEISEFLGEGTNQIAELTAILRGLEELPDRTRPVVVYSDSAYAIGLLTQAWKAKANVDLVEQLRALCREFRDLRFVKVAGHSGVPLNERTDQLAGQAIARRR